MRVVSFSLSLSLFCLPLSQHSPSQSEAALSFKCVARSFLIAFVRLRQQTSRGTYRKCALHIRRMWHKLSDDAHCQLRSALAVTPPTPITMAVMQRLFHSFTYLFSFMLLSSASASAICLGLPCFALVCNANLFSRWTGHLYAINFVHCQQIL